MSLIKELEELQVKANKYDNLAGRYVEHAEELGKIIEALIELKSKIDPVAGNSSDKSYIGRGVIMEAINDLHRILLSGTEVTRELVEKSYPEFSIAQHHYIMQVLKNRNGVLQRKEGHKSILYVQKEV